MLGSTLSFGSLAVSGFFVISGYLITGSFLNSKSLASYFTKRIFRIYPAFAVASLVCVLIVAPLGGGHFEDGVFSKIGKSIINILILARPKFDGVFVGQHHLDKYSALDGAMWTIQYEFTCYILIALIGVTGGLRKPVFIVCIAALLFGIAIVIPTETLSLLCHAKLFPGLPQALPNMVGLFFTGASFCLFRKHIFFSPKWAFVAAIALVYFIRYETTASIGFGILGGYLIFSAAHYASGTRLSYINDKNDISYGLYLYAWPIERLMIEYSGTTNLFVIGAGTLFLAAICGWASWTLIERPALQWAHRPGKRVSKQP